MLCKKIISHRIGKIVPVLAKAMETTKNLIMKRKFQEHLSNQSNTIGATNGTGTVYPFGAPKFIPGFQWGLCCLIFSVLCNVLQIVVFPFSFDHYIVSPSSIYGFWLHLWYLPILLPTLYRRVCSKSHFSFDHCIISPSSIYGFWLHLWYLLMLLPTLYHRVCSKRVTFLLIIVLSVLLRFTASGYTFGIFKLFFKTVIAINSSIEYDFLTILRY